FSTAKADGSGTPGILIYDAARAGNVVVSRVPIPAATNGSTTDGGVLLTTDGSSLILYTVGPAKATPATVTVTIPTAEGVSVVPNSFSLAPTQITNGPTTQTLEWDLSYDAGHTADTITWQSTVSGLQPGEGRTVATQGGVTFTSQGTPGTIALPDQ